MRSILLITTLLSFTSLSAQTIINNQYMSEQGGRTVGSMNKCIKEGSAALYTDGVCPSGYQLQDSKWEDNANFSYKEDPNYRARRDAELESIELDKERARQEEQARMEAAAGPEVKSGDLKKDMAQLGGIMTLMGADTDDPEMDIILQQTAKQFLPDDVDISNIKFKDAFDYGIRTLFDPDSIINEALGIEE